MRKGYKDFDIRGVPTLFKFKFKNYETNLYLLGLFALWSCKLFKFKLFTYMTIVDWLLDGQNPRNDLFDRQMF